MRCPQTTCFEETLSQRWQIWISLYRCLFYSFMPDTKRWHCNTFSKIMLEGIKRTKATGGHLRPFHSHSQRIWLKNIRQSKYNAMLPSALRGTHDEQWNLMFVKNNWACATHLRLVLGAGSRTHLKDNWKGTIKSSQIVIVAITVKTCRQKGQSERRRKEHNGRNFQLSYRVL